MQDTTIRIWDIRRPERSAKVLRGRVGAIRSLRYSSDGLWLAAAEPMDFVHLYDVHDGYKR